MKGSTASSRPYFIVSPFRPIEFSTHSAWSTWYASIYLVAWKNNNFQLSVFHPASYTCTVDRSLSGIQAKLKVRRLRMQITQSRDWLRNLEIGTQSQDSENAQRNLEIALILRLRGTCTQHCYKFTLILPLNENKWCRCHWLFHALVGILQTSLPCGG